MSSIQPVIEEVIKQLPRDRRAIVIVPSHRFKLFLASELNSRGVKIPYMFQLPELIDQLYENLLLADNPFIIEVALYKFLENNGFWTQEGHNQPLFRRLAIIRQILKDFEELLLNLPLNEDVLKVVENIGNYYKTGIEFHADSDEQKDKYLAILSEIWHVEQMTTVPEKQKLEFIYKLWYLTGAFFCKDGGIRAWTRRIWGVHVVTEGLLLRNVLKDNSFIGILNKRFNNPKIIVAGFGALDIVYFEIFKLLKERLGDNVVFIWEGGEWLEQLHKYILNPFFGTYKNIKNKYKQYSIVYQINELGGIKVPYPLNGSSQEVEIHIVPNRTSQIGLLSNLITHREEEDSKKLSLILLLQKDLGSLLWHSFEKINLSMGLPLALTPVKSFFDLLDELLYLITSKDQATLLPAYYYVKWHEHPIGKHLVKSDQGNDSQQVIDPSNSVLVSSDLWKNEVINFLTAKGHEAISSLLNMLHYLDEQLSTDEKQNISRASIQQIALVVHFLRTILEHLQNLTAKDIIQLLRSMIFSQQVVLKGEPLYGLQAMEILETRGLVFDEVFIPDVSETTFPPPERTISMIPMSIRFFFGLPTPEIISFRNYYYLYRLLASTKGKIRFIVPSNMDGQPTQKSIVLNQLNIMFPSKKMKQIVYAPSPMHKPKDADLSFVESLLTDHYKQSESKQFDLYVTELVRLLECPRKFLLSKLIAEKTKEPYNLLGTDGRLIGDIVHNALAMVYKNGVDLEKIKELIDGDNELTSLLEGVFSKLVCLDQEIEYIKHNLHKIPSFSLSKQYVLSILKRDYDLLNNDTNEAISDIIHEQAIKSFDENLKIEGRIDRIEKRKSGDVRIVDFKHGLSKNKINIPQTQIIERIKTINNALIGDDSYDSKTLPNLGKETSYAIQVMLYKQLYIAGNNEQFQANREQIKAFIYSISGISAERENSYELEVSITDRTKKNKRPDKELEEEFMGHILELARTVAEKFQSSNLDSKSMVNQFFPIYGDQCRYCAFRNICFRYEE